VVEKTTEGRVWRWTESRCSLPTTRPLQRDPDEGDTRRPQMDSLATISGGWLPEPQRKGSICTRIRQCVSACSTTGRDESTRGRGCAGDPRFTASGRLSEIALGLEDGDCTSPGDCGGVWLVSGLVHIDSQVRTIATSPLNLAGANSLPHRSVGESVGARRQRPANTAAIQTARQRQRRPLASRLRPSARHFAKLSSFTKNAGNRFFNGLAFAKLSCETGAQKWPSLAMRGSRRRARI
jgi:hypothetical protein